MLASYILPQNTVVYFLVESVCMLFPDIVCSFPYIHLIAAVAVYLVCDTFFSACSVSCILEIGNGIHHSLQLTGDAPSLHSDGKMPFLDLGNWTDRRKVDREETRYIVIHEFYAKEVSAKHVTHAHSAMPTSMKRTVLTQELLRVMLICSPLLEW